MQSRAGPTGPPKAAGLVRKAKKTAPARVAPGRRRNLTASVAKRRRAGKDDAAAGEVDTAAATAEGDVSVSVSVSASASASHHRTPRDARIDGLRARPPSAPSRGKSAEEALHEIMMHSVPTSNSGRSRPPCPPEPKPTSFSREAKNQERKYMLWLIEHETLEEFRQRRRRQHQQMRNRPKRPRARVDPHPSLHNFEARLRAKKTKEDFACTDGKFLADFQFSGVHTNWSEMPTNIRARALCIIAKIAMEYGFKPLGIVSHHGRWAKSETGDKVYDDKGHRVKIFFSKVPEGTRLFVGRRLEIQEEVEDHPLAFLPKDEVPVGGRRRKGGKATEGAADSNSASEEESGDEEAETEEAGESLSGKGRSPAAPAAAVGSAKKRARAAVDVEFGRYASLGFEVGQGECLTDDEED